MLKRCKNKSYIMVFAKHFDICGSKAQLVLVIATFAEDKCTGNLPVYTLLKMLW